MNHFELISEYEPTGDQPEAIRELTEGVLAGEGGQTLLGVSRQDVYHCQCDQECQQAYAGVESQQNLGGPALHRIQEFLSQ